MKAAITNDLGDVIEEYEFNQENAITGHVIETILSKRVSYSITVMADRGTTNERSITDKLYVSAFGKYIEPEEITPEQDTLLEMIEEDTYIMLEQAVLGDFSQSLSAAGIASRIVIGFIPVAGQASDVRDVTAQCIYVDPESGKVSIDVNTDGLAISLIAFMPAGDLLKFGNKTIAKNSPEWIKLAKATAKAMDGADEAYLVIKREGKVIKKAIEGIGFDDFYKYMDVGDNLVALEIVKDSAKYVLSYIDSAADDVADMVDDAYKAAAETGKQADGVGKTISESDRIKINSWIYTPSDELYLKYKDVYDNPLYYDQLTGEINWPAEDGFKDGRKIEKEITQGTIFKRYGENTGEFLGNAKDPFELRALAPHSELAEIHYYQLTENYKMTMGEVAPWFGSEGGAEQFVKYKPDGSKYTIKELEDIGVLEDITDLVEKGEIMID